MRVGLLILFLAFGAACQEAQTVESTLECGEGTQEIEGACLPVNTRSCGEGTVDSQGVCVPRSRLSCGPGTRRDGASCVAIPTPDPCADGTVSVDGTCLPDIQALCGLGTVPVDGRCQTERAVWLHMPFAEGTLFSLSQGIATHHTHSGASRFALDFPLDEGTEIVAPANGRVLMMRSDSDKGCNDPSCLGDDNKIHMQLEDGNVLVLAHLQKDGVFVKPGDTVCRGEVIGLSGNTGYSSGPHLHIAVLDVYRESIPIYFHELKEFSGGVPMYGITLQSENAPLETCEPVGPERCASDIFLHRGVELTSDFPCRAVTPGSTTVVKGNSLAQGAWVHFSIKSPGDEEFQTLCHPVLPDGSFEFEVDWPMDASGQHYFMMGTAHDNCVAYYGWEHSPGVFLIDDLD